MSEASIMSPAGTCDQAKVFLIVEGIQEISRKEEAIKEMEAKADQMYKELDNAKNINMALVRDLNVHEMFLLQCCIGK